MNRKIFALLVVFVAPQLVWGEVVPPAPDASVDSRLLALEGKMERLSDEVGEIRRLLAELASRLPPATSATLDQRLEQLEATQAELATASQAIATSVLEQTDTVASLARSEQQRTQLNTYGTINLVDPANANQVYDAEAFEIVLSGQPTDRFGFFAEVEFERAATVGGPRGGEVLVEQAYATFTLVPGLNARAGVVLVPFGNVNLDHYAPNRDVISKPLVSYAIAPSDWTDNGFGFQGSRFFGAGDDSIVYELYSVSGLDANIGPVGTRAARQSFGSDNNNDKAWVGRLAWSHGGAFELGLSGYTGAVDDAGRDRLDGWAIDAHWQLGHLLLTGEFDRLLTDTNRLEGWYGRATYRLPLNWLHSGAHGRIFPESHVDVVFQYDHARVEGVFAGGPETNREWRQTFGLNYHPSHHWVLKINHERSEAPNQALQFGTRRAWLGSVGFQF